MNTQQLIEAMRSGATLNSQWKPRSFSLQRAKKLYVLTYPTGEKVHVQYSAVSAALKIRAICITRVQIGNTEHYGLMEAEL